MSRFRQSFASTLLLFSVFCFGCGQSQPVANSKSDNEDGSVDDLLADLDPADKTAQLTAAPDPLSPVAKAAPGERLELRLQTGDRFPLVKTIEQSLVQKPAQFSATAQTRLDLHMVIQVNQVRDDAILMNVRYTRVFYEHDVSGHRMMFDSDTHRGVIPDDVVPYAGMVNNGFSFWLGRNNRIRELVDYQQFLERCVQQVPLERRQQLLGEISARFGDDGVANFVDDAIGLLPYDDSVDPESATRVGPGDVWSRERRVMQPVPVYMSSTYRLAALNQQTAEIDITGHIASGETYDDSRAGQTAKVKIKGGQIFGSCTVDRATGLPLELRRTRYLNLTVLTENGAAVEQDKRVITTIRSFPNTQGPVADARPRPPNELRGAPAAAMRQVPGSPIRPVSGVNHGAPRPQQRATTIPSTPSNPPLSSTVRAVYPD
ncbi:MAG: hypothetical protein GY903_09170 [Fuerstiella sp.]|nr:hypothetical protein [Fuerstiella sp.]MCP4854651.1 hypothetical protein [Fuerstiella sp.]